jgi:hypothetical protein
MTSRFSKAALLAAGAAGLMAMSACSSGGGSASTTESRAPSGAASPVAAAPADGTPSSATAKATGSGAGGTTSGAGGTTATARCTAATLEVDLTFQDQAKIPGYANWLLAVTNRSSHTCRIYGYPSFGLEDASGAPYADSTTVYVRRPGPAVAFDLKPGTTGFAGVKWKVCPTGGDLVGGLVMTPPGERSHATVTTGSFPSSGAVTLFKFCGHSVTAGTLQPSTQGVVFAS